MVDIADWNLVRDEVWQPLPPIQWLCQGALIAPGAPTLVAGYGYSGKSVATASLALSVASGRPLWGKFVLRQGRVLHLDYEQGRRLTFERYQRMAFALAIDPSEIASNLEVGVLPRKGLDTLDDLSWLGDGRALCVVDSWRASHPKVDENSSDVRPTLDRMTIASEKTGCAFLSLHHTRKPQKDSPGGAHMGIRGSSGFFDGCQTVYLFEGQEGDGGSTHRTTVTLKKDRILGTKEGSFDLVIRDTDEGRGLSVEHAPRDEKAPPSLSEEFEALVSSVEECVRQNPGLAGADVVALRVGRQASKVRAVVGSLVAEGRLKKVGGKGTSVRLYHSSYEFNGHAPF